MVFFENGLFPIGLEGYVIGGILIGFAIAFVFLTTGITAGVSRLFTNLLSYVVKYKYFHTKEREVARSYNAMLGIGLILGGLIFTFGFNKGSFFVTGISWVKLLIGGILVGFGTRMGRGCTSGHGICGSSARSTASIVATCIFLIVAIIVANLVLAIGGGA